MIVTHTKVWTWENHDTDKIKFKLIDAGGFFQIV